MELFAETISVVGALLLSVSCGLLLEELIFGGLVRLFFAPRSATTGISERKETNALQPEGERPCLR
jgi:hypothetical protein